MGAILIFFTVLLFALCAYYAFPKKHRFIVLLISSIVFISIMSKYLIAFLILTVVSAYFGAKWIQRNNDKASVNKEDKDYANKVKVYNKIIITCLIILNLAIIGLLKYFNFFGSIVLGIFGWFDFSFVWPRIPLALPLGISYYTLQAIGYMIDVYRKRIIADRNFLRVALFLCFFPAIQEGPICRYEQTANMLYNGADLEKQNLSFGAVRILWGLFKKSVIADRLAMLVTTIAGNPTHYSGYASLLFILFYTIELYADFSGFIDIALGSAQMFGFKLPENFKQPFFATSSQDFWKRWHITLGVWLKEYVFYSIALSPKITKFCGKIKKHWKNHFTKMLPTLFALFGVWLCNGLWHGPEWKYIFYGLYYFVLISISMLFEPLMQKFYTKMNIDPKNKWLNGFRHIRTIFIIFFGETMFGAHTLQDAWYIITSIFTHYEGNVFELGLDYRDMIIAIVAMLILLAVDIAKERSTVDIKEVIASKAIYIRWPIYILLLVAIIVFGAYGGGVYSVTPFIYGNF